jgi:hypothetical protein
MCVHRSTSATLSRVPVAVPTRVYGRTTATVVTSTGRRACLITTVTATGPFPGTLLVSGDVTSAPALALVDRQQLMMMICILCYSGN